ncbi:hypothetical protein GQ42DRAFT_164295 [Ramicandelaber brevisporus]|nr:hypothetical protein GQ42DRAFT_164295 [Ramicandelaber brevisporus]
MVSTSDYTSNVTEYTFPVDRPLKVGFGTGTTKVILDSVRHSSSSSSSTSTSTSTTTTTATSSSNNSELSPNVATVRVQLSGENEASVKEFVPKVTHDDSRSELVYNKANSGWFNTNWFGGKTVRANVEIYLPEANVTPVTELELNIVNGSIGVNSATPVTEPKTGPLANVAFGNLKVNTVNGSTTLPGITVDALEVNCVNGSTSLEGVTARSANINTVNGDVTSSFSGIKDLKITTLNGHITNRFLSTATAASAAAATSGQSVLSKYRFNTKNGGCSIGVSKHFEGTFNFSTHNGGIILPSSTQRIQLSGSVDKKNERRGMILAEGEKHAGSSGSIKAESWNGALNLFFF